MNSDKIILDLCGGTGSWSKPYKDAGYDVRVITLPEQDVKFYEPPDNVHGILAAPPCAQFSFARTKAKNLRDLEGAMQVVKACLEIIWKCQYKLETENTKLTKLKFWCLENPNGFLKYFLGHPPFIFQPYQFGDMYQKTTCLWGHFDFPKPIYADKIAGFPKFGSDRDIKFRFNAEAKSVTPPGFSKAFMEANK